MPQGPRSDSPNPSNPSRRAGASASEQPGVLDRDGARSFAAALARSLLDDKCDDVRILDIADLTTVTACLVIGTGTSDRQMRAALKNLEEAADRFGSKPMSVSADDNATWLLADYVDVVVHLFEPNARAYYDLESMWSDAGEIQPEPPKRQTDGNRAS
ncbi:MAG: ribosome silencing factor [Phycisphaerales bacterium]|nr:ribosome silencing factor [Planctomycetota bacterium]MCH8507431.1 ribosome silencing factor [Phycisphaerales bacterium]